MSHNVDARSLHKKAATEHEAAVKHHHKAAQCHDQNKVSDAKGSSKSAITGSYPATNTFISRHRNRTLCVLPHGQPITCCGTLNSDGA